MFTTRAWALLGPSKLLYPNLRSLPRDRRPSQANQMRGSGSIARDAISRFGFGVVRFAPVFPPANRCAGRTKKKPRQFPAGGFAWRLVRRSGSEVTLSANVEGHGVLVLVLVDGRRLGSRRGQDSRTSELLVEGGPQDFGRERQVLDGSPAGNKTKHRDVEVRITSEIRAYNLTGAVVRTNVSLRGAIVTNRGVAAEQARRPVRIPVVVERTTDTVRSRQMQIAIAAGCYRKIDSIGGATEADALVGARTTSAAEHREARRATAGGDHLLGVTLCPGRVDLEVVAGTSRDVLDLQRSHHRTAPLGIGVSTDFRQGCRSCTCETRRTSGSRCRVEYVVGAVHFVTNGRDLEQTPSLIDTDVADDVRSMHAGVGVGDSAGRSKRQRQVGDGCAVVHGRLIETDGAGHAIAELRGVLDVVHAGD